MANLRDDQPRRLELLAPIRPGGYSINIVFAAQRNGYPGGSEQKTHRLGSIIPSQDVLTPNPTSSDVVILAEQVRNGDGAISYGIATPAIAAGPNNSTAGKIEGMGTISVPDVNHPVYTPQGRATRSYLDGHAASREASDLGWTATSPITGEWSTTSSSILSRRAPWFLYP